MPVQEKIITILCVVLGTMTTRFLPFIIFPPNKKTPKFLQYLSLVLPSAIIGFLVVYCFKNVSFVSGSHGLPEIISLLFITLLHLWKKNTLLSIAGGTILYMVLVQSIF